MGEENAGGFGRISFLQSEDNLLALGLDQFVGLYFQTVYQN